MPDHRGQRIGLALKLATYDRLRGRHPDRTVIHTWTELDNQPMLRTNDRFGYQIADRLYEVQRIG